MTDVRSLLRTELSTRRITHPHLSYPSTKSSSPVCTICNLSLRSDSLWDRHSRSPQHLSNLRKSQTQNGTTTTSSSSRKRKLSPEDEDDESTATGPNLKRKLSDTDDTADVEDVTTASSSGGQQQHQSSSERGAKKPRSLRGVPEGFFDEGIVPAETVEEPSSPLPSQIPVTTKLEPPPSIDESEWLAFSREVAPLAQQQQNPYTTSSNATITAAPISAAELAQQQKEQGREAREVELEDEKEEAARNLEEEFEVMEEMEERVRRLKEKREELRRVKNGQEASVQAVEEDTRPGNAAAPEEHLEEVEEEDDEDDEEDLDGWGFR